ncbi:MAG: peroxiredoxin-like family protein [Bdellovibrionales bacterium]
MLIKKTGSPVWALAILFTTALGVGGLVLEAGAAEQSPTLREQLAEKAAEAKAKAPDDRAKIMQNAIDDLRKQNIIKKAKNVGAKIPSFSLPDAKRGIVKSKDLLGKPLIIVFYRGGWCPYCNLQLRDLQKHLPEIKAAGAELVAISPEAPDRSLETVKKNDLGFYVLSDAGGKVSKKFGLVFELPKDLQKLYGDFGIDLPKHNQSKKWELPLGASYVVDSKGKITYAFLEADYKLRAETTDLIAEVQKLAPKRVK